jgi:hypothetical protein
MGSALCKLQHFDDARRSWLEAMTAFTETGDTAFVQKVRELLEFPEAVEAELEA